jgi:hypothetical protein
MINGHKKKTAFFVVVCSLILASCNKEETPNTTSSNSGAFCTTPQAFSDDIFTDVFVATDKSEPDKNVKRRRHVNVDVTKLKAKFLANRKMKLPLFANKSVDLTLDKVEKLSDDNIIVTASIPQHDGSATLVINGNNLVANINDPLTDEHFEIRTSSTDIHTIDEVLAEPEACEPEKAPADSGGPVIANDSEGSKPVIDILAVYTPRAAAYQGGDDAMKALLQMGVADTNRAFADSGINLSARLVGVLALKTNESDDMHADLSALRTNGDGRWDEVHAERTRLGADQVSFIGRYYDPSIGGVGYVGSSKSTAFTVVKITLFKQYTFSHELGHNIGMNHSDGIENTAGHFRTIMAYGTQPRLRRYSNPNIPYNGYATGDATHNSAAIGNANASKISNLVNTIVPYTEIPLGGEETQGGSPQPPEIPGNGCT